MLEPSTRAKRSKTKTTKKAPTNGAALAARMTAAKRRLADLEALIARRISRIKDDFYDIALALREIRDKRLFAAAGFDSFRAYSDARVGMSRSTAHALVAILDSGLAREQALLLGHQRAIELVRYAGATPEPDTAGQLFESGRVAGKPIEATTTRDLRAARAKLKPPKKPKPDPELAVAQKLTRTHTRRLIAAGIKPLTATVHRKGKTLLATLVLPVEHLARLRAK